VMECSHDVLFGGMCAVCGNVLESGHTVELLQFQRPGLAISKREAQRISKDEVERLFQHRKLSLVLDLDNTLIHAITENFLNPSILSLLNQPNYSSEIFRFTLPNCPTKYFLKLRPYLMDFLTSLAPLYEMHIYTHGTRQYANHVASIMNHCFLKSNSNSIKSVSVLFAEHRIISRDDTEDWNSKNLNQILPCDDSMVVVVDDREDVWMSNASSRREPIGNLCRIEPYHYFDLFREIRELPNDGTQSTSSNEQVTDSDDHLKVVMEVLLKVHRSFYAQDNVKKHDTKKILKRLRKCVLAGCHLVFTGLLPLHRPPEESELWCLASKYGAHCAQDIELGVTTHLIAAKFTDKVEVALRVQGIFVVHVNWRVSNTREEYIHTAIVSYIYTPFE